MQASAISDTATGSLGSGQNGETLWSAGRAAKPATARSRCACAAASCPCEELQAAGAGLHLRLEPVERGLADHAGEPLDQPLGRGHVAAGQPVRPDGDEGRQHLRAPEPGRQHLGPPVVRLDLRRRIALHRADAQGAQHPGGELAQIALLRLGQAVQQLEDAGEQPDGLEVCAACLLRLGGGDVQIGGPVGIPRQVQVLGDQRGLGARGGDRVRHGGVRRPPHLEDLGLVGGVAHERVAEAVGARRGPMGSTIP